MERAAPRLSALEGSDRETLRIYLAQNAHDGFGTTNEDGGYNALGANGFERLTE